MLFISLDRCATHSLLKACLFERSCKYRFLSQRHSLTSFSWPLDMCLDSWLGVVASHERRRRLRDYPKHARLVQGK